MENIMLDFQAIQTIAQYIIPSILIVSGLGVCFVATTFKGK